MKNIFLSFRSCLYMGAIVSLLVSCDNTTDTIDPMQTGSVVVEFENIVGDASLELNKDYTNASGETFKITTLNYFISNIKLRNADGSEYTVPQDSSYFLVKASEANSNLLRINNVPAGDYKGITFTIGVDSLRSTLDVSKRTGVLDVGGTAAGMYWQWNSGYIFMKIEGTSPVVPVEQNNQFYYHIGGFGGLNSKTLNNIRTRNLDFGSSRILVRPGKKPMIHLQMDMQKVFQSPNAYKIADYPVVMFAPFSTKIAENYVNAFTFDHVHN